MDGDIQIMKFIHNVRVLNPRDATELCGAVMCPDHDPELEVGWRQSLDCVSTNDMKQFACYWLEDPSHNSVVKFKKNLKAIDITKCNILFRHIVTYFATHTLS